MPTKAQIAALALATSVGAAGGALAVKSSVEPPVYRVHAMDLRTRPAPDGGISIGARIWASRQLPDGGWKDLGKGWPCPVSESAARELMKSGEACVSEE